MMLTCQPSSSFNRTALLHTEHVTLCNSATAVQHLLYSTGSVAPNSHDLSPVDYKIWSVVQQRVYQSWMYNVDELKQRLVHVWHDIDQTIIDSAIDEWRGILRDCVWTKGGHFEQML